MPESEIVARLGLPLRVDTTYHLNADGSTAKVLRWHYATASFFYPSLNVAVLSEKRLVTAVSVKYWDTFLYSNGPIWHPPEVPTFEQLLDE